MAWSHQLARAARFHSANLVLAGCGLQHDSPCTVRSDISSLYDPGSCDGSPGCACTDSASCGASRTVWSTRIGYFYSGGGGVSENIARGSTDPIGTFYLWLHEPDSSSTCGWRVSNGHRYNILNGSMRSIGVGKHSSTYTQDFAGAGSVSGLVAGVHYPSTGSSLAFRANWYSTAGPTSAQVNVDGTCHAMSRERGSATNGTWLATVGGLDGSCHRYFFEFETGSGTEYYPTTGSFGINCASEWSSTRPAPCGACTPDCSGRERGDDGCGGSCGTCAGGAACNGSGACACPSGETMCGGTCVDTATDEAHCGACDDACSGGEECVSGACTCVPSCSGRECGGDGCGGSCGTCGSDEACSAGTCVCSGALTDCGGTCVDVRIDEANCGSCGTACAADETCLSGTCTTDMPDGGCTPACTGRECGGDTCGGSCGTCGAAEICTGGACIAASDGGSPAADGGAPGSDGGTAGGDGGTPVGDGRAADLDAGAAIDGAPDTDTLAGRCACRAAGAAQADVPAAPIALLLVLAVARHARRRRRLLLSSRA